MSLVRSQADALIMAKQITSLAIISGSRDERDYLERGFSPFSSISVIYKGSSPTTGISNLGKLALLPSLVLICEGSPNTFSYELNPQFPKIRKYAPDAKILVRTDKNAQDPFVRAVLDAEGNIVSRSLDIVALLSVFDRIQNGEQVALYETRSSGEREYYSRQRNHEQG